MTRKKTSYSSASMRRTSRRVQTQVVGTHVKRPVQKKPSHYNSHDSIRRKVGIRRFIAGFMAVVIIVGAAFGMGILTFRGLVGSSMALKDSDAQDALVVTSADEPYFALIVSEFGSVAAPLDNGGPDSFILARVDNAAQSICLIAIPSQLQLSYDNKTVSLESLAQNGDAKLISTLANYLDIDISHYVKLSEDGLSSMVDTLQGVTLVLEQSIDDPQAGDVYFPAGNCTLNGQSSLMYLRATNLKLGLEDTISHHLKFASLLMEKLFSSNFSSKIDSVDECFQTDMSLSELETIASWFNGKSASDITTTLMPGYFSSSVNLNSSAQSSSSYYVGSSSEFASLIEQLEAGENVALSSMDNLLAADAAGVSLDVMNGTSVTGAASATATLLQEAGFTIGSVGNADQQVYEETLVVYRNDSDLSKAKAVIEALGVGRVVDASAYYSFDTDLLLIIGSDFSPLS